MIYGCLLFVKVVDKGVFVVHDITLL